jgi:hypothetical protein
MIHLAGVDQIVALPPSDVDAVPLVSIEREAGDGQRLPLRAGLLRPAIAPAARIGAVADFRHQAFQAASLYFRT